MNTNDAIAGGLEKITSCLEQMHQAGLKQHEFNQMVIKTLGVLEQDIELLKVTLGEMKKEARHVRA